MTLIKYRNTDDAAAPMDLFRGAPISTGGDEAGFPSVASTNAGRLHFREDLADWFYRDDTREKWVGTQLIAVGGWYSASRAATNYLKMSDGGTLVYSATMGFVAPFQMTCVGMAAAVAASSTCTFSVYDDGSAVGSAVLALSSATSGRDIALDTGLIAAGSVVSLAVTAGTAVDGTHLTAYFRRTEA